VTRTRVAVKRVGERPDAAVAGLFQTFPDITRRMKSSEKIFIKINAVYFHAYLHTSPRLIEAVVKYIRELDPNKDICFMENPMQGMPAQLAFSTIGLDKMAERLRIGCLCLDEEESVEVTIGEGDEAIDIDFPRVLYDNLILDGKNNFYLNMPILKAHCQAKMTAGIKNQLGLLYDHDKLKNHNQGLHQKLVNILAFIKPDFTLVDAVKVLARGPVAPSRFINELLREKDTILGGEDTVAVDAVCAKILGYDPAEVKQVALAAQQGLGVGRLEEIDVVGEMPSCTERVPWELEAHFPSSLSIVVGKGGACYEGCLGHFEQTIELLVNEKGGPEDYADRPLTVVTGKDVEASQLEDLQEPIILLGKCACKDAGAILRERYQRVDVLDTCGQCNNIGAYIAQNLGIDVFDLLAVPGGEDYGV